MTIKINTKDMNPGIFFSWPGDGPADEGITIRSITNDKMDEFTKTTTTERTELIDNKAVKIKDFDEDAFNDLMYQYCIVTWTGIEDTAGKPIKCTDAMKMKIMREHPTLPGLINTAIALAKSEKALTAENELKNSFRS